MICSICSYGISHLIFCIHTFRQMEEMVLGEDYDREDVVITDKRSEDASADNAISQNYFFYYHGGKTNEYNKRMQVPERIRLTRPSQKLCLKQ